MSFFVRLCGGELQCEVEIFKEVRLDHFLVDHREIDRWRGRRRRLLQIGRERLDFVAGLNLDHVVACPSGLKSWVR